MIFLLGTNHKIQTECKNPGPLLKAKLDRFRKYIDDAARSHGIKIIAEETSLELERKEGKSIARCIAEELSLQYIPCDPDSERRKKLGIPTDTEVLDRRPPELPMEEWPAYRDSELEKYFPVRENFWLEKIRPSLPGPVLLICGANHARTFPSRLGDIQHEVLLVDWWDADDDKYGELPLQEIPL